VLGCKIGSSLFHSAGQVIMYGGGVVAGATLVAGEIFFTNNAVVHGAVTADCGFIDAFTGGCFADGNWSVFTGGQCVAVGTFWGSFNLTVNPGSTFANLTGSTNVLKALLTSGTLKLGTSTNGTPPSVGGTFVANGATPVAVAPVGGQHFPANAVVSFSMNTEAGTAAPVFFSATQAADSFQVNSSALNTSTYNWRAFAGSVAITPANLDTYNGLYDEATGARFCNTT
jgi:hypothetical protein